MRIFLPVMALAVLSSSALAATTTTTFNVTATVTAQCSATATNLNFGAIDPLSATASNSTNQINATCTNGTPFNIALNPGLHGTFATRKMQLSGTTDEINYNLYTDAGRTTVWGDASAGTSKVSGTGTGSAVTETVYGQVPGSQTAAKTGAYSDTITVTVDY